MDDDDDEVDPEGGTSLFDEVQERGVWLVCLLVLQSVSGMVLQRYEEMLSRHVIITVFLTMLVGAGVGAVQWYRSFLNSSVDPRLG